jgi:PadR family transcriptional regulator PadR
VSTIDSQLKKGLYEYGVLAYLQTEDSYGYKIVQNISPIFPVTESTLYPILKRLATSQRVTSYSKIFNGRMRKYYQITDLGKKSIDDFLKDWQQVEKIYHYIKGSAENGSTSFL